MMQQLIQCLFHTKHSNDSNGPTARRVANKKFWKEITIMPKFKLKLKENIDDVKLLIVLIVAGIIITPIGVGIISVVMELIKYMLTSSVL